MASSRLLTYARLLRRACAVQKKKSVFEVLARVSLQITVPLNRCMKRSKSGFTFQPRYATSALWKFGYYFPY
jgi:hypothetical protein